MKPETILRQEKYSKLQNLVLICDAMDEYRRNNQTESETKVEKFEKWLVQYRYYLQSTNVYHQNQATINEIDKLLNP